MTLALTALLGALALGTDVAVIYFNWMQLRKAADAAALAGAAYLGPFGAQSAPISSCSWGGGGIPAYDVACSYAEQNGIAANEIVSIGPATALPASVIVPPGAQTLQVSLRRNTIPMFFASFVLPAGSNFAAAVDATAVGPAPLQTIQEGMFPAGLNDNAIAPSTAQSYPQPITLSADGSGANFVWLDLPTCNPIGSTPPANFQGRGDSLSATIVSGSTCSYSIGDTIGVVPSGRTAGLEDAMNRRISIENVPPPSLDQLNSSDPQVVVVPLVRLGQATGGSGRTHETATVEGFATVWLSSYDEPTQTIMGDFMQFTTEYGIGGAQTAYGAYSIPYLID